MKADSASHLLRQPINFELFLFMYLVCALLLQKINIYKTNYHRVDSNLVIFIIVILGRRLAWCILQQVQSHWKPKPSTKSTAWQNAKLRSSKGGGGGGGWITGGWDMFMWNWSVNLKRLVIVLCTVPAVLWSVLHLIQNTPIFNLLFLFYPLLLYLSLFGFTLEPRCYRDRFRPPSTFLQHLDFTGPYRHHTPSGHTPSSPHSTMQHKTDIMSENHTWNYSSPPHSGIHNAKSATSVPITVAAVLHHQNGPNSLHHRHHNHNNSSKDRSTAADLPGKGAPAATEYVTHLKKTNLPVSALAPPGSNHVIRIQRVKPSSSSSPSSGPSETIPPSPTSVAGFRWSKNMMAHFKPDATFLLPTMPDEVREEVEVLLSDLIVRLKQLLFNSLLCAYYVGFIPIQFADSHLYYDKWWCVEHGFLVWANSFVILASHLLPPSYCHVLYQCSQHLGCWTRVNHSDTAQVWSPDVIWLHDVIVQWNGESFRGDGPQNVAIPCDSSQECFYLLFHSRLHVHSWLLTMQCITVAFQLVVLLRSVFWFQTLSMSVFLLFNCFILYKLLYNRLSLRKSSSLT